MRTGRRAGRLALALCALALNGCALLCEEADEAFYGREPRARGAPAGKLAAAREPPPSPPRCEWDGGEGKRLASRAPAETDANAALALRIKLEYERECYRQAEQRVRARLKKLLAQRAAGARASD